MAGAPHSPYPGWGPTEQPCITLPPALQSQRRVAAPLLLTLSCLRAAATVSHAGWGARPGRRPASRWPPSPGRQKPDSAAQPPAPNIPGLPAARGPTPWGAAACTSHRCPPLVPSMSPPLPPGAEMQRPKAAEHRPAARPDPPPRHLQPPCAPGWGAPCPGCPVHPAQHRCACHSGDELIVAGAEPGQDGVPPRLRHPLAPSSSPVAASKRLRTQRDVEQPARAISSGPAGQRGTTWGPRGQQPWDAPQLQDALRPRHLPTSLLSFPSCGVRCLPGTHVAQGGCQAPLPVPGRAGRGREKGCLPTGCCRGFGHPWEPGTAPDLGVSTRPISPAERQTQQDKQPARWRTAAGEMAFAASA